MSPAELGHDLGPLRLTGIIRQDAQVALCAAVHRQRAERRLVKLLLPGAFPGAAVRRFLRQAGALASLQHPGLSPVFESARLSSGAAYVVLPPLEGEPADEWLRRAGSLAARPMIAAAIVAAVAESCSQLGRLEVVHGDLRAGSLRLTPGPRPGLFTVKVAGSEEAALRPWRMVDGQTGPAPACRAPELWRSGALPDVRSDIYALGCLYVELLTGAPAFQAEDEGAWRTAHCEHPPPFVPGIAVETRRLVGRMLAKAPEQRYQSMDEIVTAVELMLGRHRSRFAELLVAEPPLRAPEPEAGTSDLTPLGAALTGDAADEWVSGTLGTLRGLGAAAREAILGRLVALRRTQVDESAAARTILVAEDDDDTRESVVELLEEHGYRVIAARHGREAQEHLLNGVRAECMLMDLWMPEMDGWTLAAEMQEGRLPSVPTIVMTAAEPHWGYPSAIVVRKPFDSRQLLGLVESVSGTARDAEAPPPIRR